MWRQLKKGEEGGNKRQVGGITPALLAPAWPAPGSGSTQGDCFGKPSHSGCSNHSRSPEVSFHLSNVKSQKGQLPWKKKGKLNCCTASAFATQALTSLNGEKAGGNSSIFWLLAQRTEENVSSIRLHVCCHPSVWKPLS